MYLTEEQERELDSILSSSTHNEWYHFLFEKAMAIGLRNTKNKHGIRLMYHEILCTTETQAQGIADFLEDLGFYGVRTGYYDPEEDERDGCVDEYTGLYYVDWD